MRNILTFDIMCYDRFIHTMRVRLDQNPQVVVGYEMGGQFQ